MISRDDILYSVINKEIITHGRVTVYLPGHAEATNDTNKLSNLSLHLNAMTEKSLPEIRV